MASFTFEREVAAPPETVFDVLVDHRGYADITPMRKVELEREGEPAPNGVGAIRVLHSVGPPLREEVHRLRAAEPLLLQGCSPAPRCATTSAPWRSTPAGAGTKVTYAVRTIPTVPVVGAAVVAVVKLAIKQLLNGIVAESERRAASG